MRTTTHTLLITITDDADCPLHESAALAKEIRQALEVVGMPLHPGVKPVPSAQVDAFPGIVVATDHIRSDGNAIRRAVFHHQDLHRP